MLRFLNKYKKLAFYSQKIIPILSLLLILLQWSNAHAQTNQSPVVVELFTSKLCPACPAADRNFNQLLENNPNIIGLACHVSYFDRETRKDKLSAPFCDARQHVYKLALKTGKIFTPMTIANGSSMASGIHMGDIQTIVKNEENKINRLVGFYRNNGYLDIELPRIPLNAPADIWLFEVTKNPNAQGYTHYRNAVTNITKLMRWNGDPINMAFPAPAKPGTHHALIIQNYKNGILAAAQTR